MGQSWLCMASVSAVRSNQAVNSSKTIVSNPERVAPALAQVVVNEGQGDVVLGQAWLVDTDKLITCGHVVDRYCQNPQALRVRFPLSNNSYPIRQIKLHPSFVRQ